LARAARTVCPPTTRSATVSDKAIESRKINSLTGMP
jgi:hypothetical protein